MLNSSMTAKLRLHETKTVVRKELNGEHNIESVERLMERCRSENSELKASINAFKVGAEHRQIRFIKQKEMGNEPAVILEKKPKEIELSIKRRRERINKSQKSGDSVDGAKDAVQENCASTSFFSHLNSGDSSIRFDLGFKPWNRATPTNDQSASHQPSSKITTPIPATELTPPDQENSSLVSLYTMTQKHSEVELSSRSDYELSSKSNQKWNVIVACKDRTTETDRCYLPFMSISNEDFHEVTTSRPKYKNNIDNTQHSFKIKDLNLGYSSDLETLSDIDSSNYQGHSSGFRKTTMVPTRVISIYNCLGPVESSDKLEGTGEMQENGNHFVLDSKSLNFLNKFDKACSMSRKKSTVTLQNNQDQILEANLKQKIFPNSQATTIINKIVLGKHFLRKIESVVAKDFTKTHSNYIKSEVLQRIIAALELTCELPKPTTLNATVSVNTGFCPRNQSTANDLSSITYLTSEKSVSFEPITVMRWHKHSHNNSFRNITKVQSRHSSKTYSITSNPRAFKISRLNKDIDRTIEGGKRTSKEIKLSISKTAENGRNNIKSKKLVTKFNYICTYFSKEPKDFRDVLDLSHKFNSHKTIEKQVTNMSPLFQNSFSGMTKYAQQYVSELRRIHFFNTPNYVPEKIII